MYKFKAKNAALGVPMFLKDGTPVKYVQEIKRRNSNGKSMYLCLIQLPDEDVPIITYEGDDKNTIYMAGEDVTYPCVTIHDLLSFEGYIARYIKCWLSAYKDIMVHYSDQYENLQQMKEHISELVKMLDDEEIELSVRIERILEWLTKNHKSLWL